MSKYSNSRSSGGGIGIFGVLTIVFIVLKLVGVINWSWLWVLSPLWIGFIIGIIALGILYLIFKDDFKDEIKTMKKSKRSDKLKW